MPIIHGNGKQLKNPGACRACAMPWTQALRTAQDKAWQGLRKGVRPHGPAMGGAGAPLRGPLPFRGETPN
jgi:hypothetical protein